MPDFKPIMPDQISNLIWGIFKWNDSIQGHYYWHRWADYFAENLGKERFPWENFQEKGLNSRVKPFCLNGLNSVGSIEELSILNSIKVRLYKTDKIPKEIEDRLYLDIKNRFNPNYKV